MTKKGQAPILISWAILVVIIAIGVFVYFAIFIIPNSSEELVFTETETEYRLDCDYFLTEEFLEEDSFGREVMVLYLMCMQLESDFNLNETILKENNWKIIIKGECYGDCE